MRSSIICAALLSAVSLSAAALAETPAIKPGAFVTTSDGKRIGRVYDLDKAKDGTVTGVSIIRDNRIIHIATDTLSSADNGLKTSLSYDDVKKLK
jgi:sporulation protein YlmC with PRC-barrel domain